VKKFLLLLIAVFVFSLLLANCKKAAKAPAEGTMKKAGSVSKSSNTEDILLTEKEVQGFIKTFPVVKKELEKLGKKVEGKNMNALQAIRTGKDAEKTLKKLDSVLKPYGLSTVTFFGTYGKIAQSYGMLSLGGPEKYYDKLIQTNKSSLNVPNIPEETKKQIEQNIKELEQQKNSEETKIIAQNCKILEKYKDDIKTIFNSK